MEVQRASVARTVAWGARCRAEFDKLAGASRAERKPKLFGIVQGGADPALRRACGEALEAIGFDGYGFGGWPLDAGGAFRPDILQMAADAMPDGKVKYAMGLGKPEEIVQCVAMGYSLFDCVIPTREARHQRSVRVPRGHGQPRRRARAGRGVLSLSLRARRRTLPRFEAG